MRIPFKDLFLAIFVLVTGVFIYQYISVWSKAQEKIAALETDKKQLQDNKLELEKLVADKQTEISKKDKHIADINSQISDAQKQITALQQKYEIARKSLFSETDEQTIANNFKQTYAATKIPSIRMVELPEGPGAKAKLPFLVMPVFFANALTNAKKKEQLCIAQKKEQENISDLKSQISKLQDEKFELQSKIAQQYKNAYEDAFQKYMAVNKDFVDYLKKPEVPELIPDWMKIIAGVATGGVLCAL